MFLSSLKSLFKEVVARSNRPRWVVDRFLTKGIIYFANILKLKGSKSGLVGPKVSQYFFPGTVDWNRRLATPGSAAELPRSVLRCCRSSKPMNGCDYWNFCFQRSLSSLTCLHSTSPTFGLGKTYPFNGHRNDGFPISKYEMFMLRYGPFGRLVASCQ